MEAEKAKPKELIEKEIEDKELKIGTKILETVQDPTVYFLGVNLFYSLIIVQEFINGAFLLLSGNIIIIKKNISTVLSNPNCFVII